MATNTDAEYAKIKELTVNTGDEYASYRSTHDLYYSNRHIAFVDNNTLISLHRNNRIIAWKIRTGEKLWQQKPQFGCYNVSVPLYNPKVFVYSDGNYRINICDTNTGKVCQTYENKQRNYLRLTDITFKLDGSVLAVSYENGTIMFVDMHKQKITYPRRGIGDITSLTWSTDDILAIGNVTGEVELFNHHSQPAILGRIDIIKYRTRILKWLGMKSSLDLCITAVALQPARKYRLATGSYDGNIAIWGINSHGKTSKLHSLLGHNKKITSLAWDPYGSILASTQIFGKYIRLWNSNTGENFAILQAKGAESISFSADGLTFASGSAFGPITIWERTN